MKGAASAVPSVYAVKMLAVALYRSLQKRGASDSYAMQQPSCSCAQPEKLAIRAFSYIVERSSTSATQYQFASIQAGASPNMTWRKQSGQFRSTSVPVVNPIPLDSVANCLTAYHRRVASSLQFAKPQLARGAYESKRSIARRTIPMFGSAPRPHVCMRS